MKVLHLVGSLALGLLVVSGFSGCEKKIHTTTYWENHHDEAEKKMEECDKAETQSESEKQECFNARNGYNLWNAEVQEKRMHERIQKDIEEEEADMKARRDSIEKAKKEAEKNQIGKI